MNAGPFLHPEWKRALAEIVALDPKPGDVIPREWLEELLELPHVTTMEEFRQRQLKWLQQFERLRDELLVAHQIWLRSTQGGYEVVPPARQTEQAYSDYSRQAFSKLKRMVRVAQHVRLSELTDSERKANADSLAKMSLLLGMVGGAMIEDKRASDDEGAAS